MNFFNKVKSLGANVAEKSKNLISNLSKDIQEVIQQQNQLIENQESESFKEKNALLPWEGLKAIKSNQNGNMIDSIKEEILDLSLQEDYFLIDDENYMYPFEFNIEDYKYQAIKILSVDPNLEFMRSKLVPKKIKDEKFWKNYFYNVEIIKMKYNMANKINQTERLEQVAIQLENNNSAEQAEEQKQQLLENKQEQVHDDHQHDEEDHQVIHDDEDDFNSTVKPKKNRFDEIQNKKESGDDFDSLALNLSDNNNKGAVEMQNINK
ncbi:BSD domain protein (macronuclear) [Tetrahymena thermophila SB210]|uniref:BSD domain protein n=1 Tax=Tetrahymena thermophila (strain SB210) TaxID=312017 RepID=Q22EH7_TETTS|nr:BSD domain protein [Tetrahymena thermophila SB210]EAR83675.2 BSD domain protein [Tetrahymena thermophila SB210]|eukprot:XP_001031338.2 BSD domain protein [Tetrahymena thermophila SB210]